MKSIIVGLLLGATVTGSGIFDNTMTVVEPTVEQLEVIPFQYKWSGSGFTESETKTLKFLQEQGITDKTALSVILGNIKQESNFYPNICEGGARVNYNVCYKGGYGIIQWTSYNRYVGLGRYANFNGGDPSTLETQLKYMVTEPQWKRAKKMFENPNKSQDYYMDAAYIWLGWGIFGNRGYYSQQYFDCLTPA